LGKALSNDLQNIYLNRNFSHDQFYVNQVPTIGNPKFTHELDYKEIKFPDAGFQILSLFRFWNIIQYWSPYRDQIRESWENVLRESIVKIALAKDRESYELELIAVIAHVHDTHANLWSSLDVRPPVGGCKLPIIVRFIEGYPVVTAFANSEEGRSSGFMVGDIVEMIDGHPVDKLIETWLPYYAASNRPTQMRDIAINFSNGSCGITKVKVRRADESKEFTTSRLPSTVIVNSGNHDRAGETFQFLENNIAYIKLSSIRRIDIPSYLSAAAGTKGLIIDIRNYPSDFVVFSLGQHLVDHAIKFVRFAMGDLSNPGAFHWGAELTMEPLKPHYPGKIMILVDETSQSQSEYTAMAFRVASKAKVIGSTTAGADGNVSLIPLPGGLNSKISGIGVFYPDKTPTQRVGIVPDIEIHPTISGIRTGLDEVLDAAISEIRRE